MVLARRPATAIPWWIDFLKRCSGVMSYGLLACVRSSCTTSLVGWRYGTIRCFVFYIQCCSWALGESLRYASVDPS
jgi:hypothetical protein